MHAMFARSRLISPLLCRANKPSREAQRKRPSKARLCAITPREHHVFIARKMRRRIHQHSVRIAGMTLRIEDANEPKPEPSIGRRARHPHAEGLLRIAQRTARQLHFTQGDVSRGGGRVCGNRIAKVRSRTDAIATREESFTQAYVFGCALGPHLRCATRWCRVLRAGSRGREEKK